jgi:hypothetical protein
MATKKEIVSKFTNLYKINNKDERVSPRFILNLLEDTATTLIAQKWLDRTILSELNLYTDVSCFQFKKIDYIDCPNVEFKTCKVLMKSINPLPKLIFSRLGASIKNIEALDGEFQFIFLDKGQYTRNKKRQVKLKNEVYVYLGVDNHLYIVDEEIETLQLTILTVKTQDVKSCNKNVCKSNWDYDFICPDKLIDVVFKEVAQYMGINRQIIEDRNPDNVAGN